MRMTLITPPAGEPLTLADAKLHLRVDGTHEDALISSMIRTARQKLDGRDGFLGRALMLQTWEMSLDAFPAREIKIPLVPLNAIVSVIYIDRDGIEQTVDAQNYEADTSVDEGWIVPVRGFHWPVTMHTINAVRIRFIAGYGGAEDVPEPIRHAIRMHTAHLYDGRDIGPAEHTKDTPLGWEQHVAPYRMWSV